MASVLTIQKITNYFPPIAARLSVALALAVLLLTSYSSRFWFHLDDYRVRYAPYQATMRRVLATVPPDASVLCTSPLLAHFCNQPAITTASTIMNWGDKKPEKMLSYDYIVIDGNWRDYDARYQGPLVEMLRTNQTHQLLFVENNVALLRRVR